MSRLHTVWVDGGFDGEQFMHWVMDFCRLIVQVVLRPKERKGFVLLPKRWVVERTLGWLVWCRRLNKDYELLPPNSRDVYLPRYDPDYNKTIGIKFSPSGSPQPR